jgi:hypothetical protein
MMSDDLMKWDADETKPSAMQFTAETTLGLYRAGRDAERVSTVHEREAALNALLEQRNAPMSPLTNTEQLGTMIEPNESTATEDAARDARLRDADRLSDEQLEWVKVKLEEVKASNYHPDVMDAAATEARAKWPWSSTPDTVYRDCLRNDTKPEDHYLRTGANPCDY